MDKAYERETERWNYIFFVLIYNLTKQPFLYIIKTPKHDVDFSRVDLFFAT
jgi:hypothetical protein